MTKSEFIELKKQQKILLQAEVLDFEALNNINKKLFNARVEAYNKRLQQKIAERERAREQRINALFEKLA